MDDEVLLKGAHVPQSFRAPSLVLLLSSPQLLSSLPQASNLTTSYTRIAFNPLCVYYAMIHVYLLLVKTHLLMIVQIEIKQVIRGNNEIRLLILK